MGPMALWVPADDDAGPPQPWMEDTHRGRVGHRQTTLGTRAWPRFRAEPPWGFTNPAQAFVSLRFVSFVPFRSFRFVLRSCAGPGYFFMFCFRWFYITLSIWEPSRHPIGSFSEGFGKSACKEFSQRGLNNISFGRL